MLDSANVLRKEIETKRHEIAVGKQRDAIEHAIYSAAENQSFSCVIGGILEEENAKLLEKLGYRIENISGEEHVIGPSTKISW